MAERGVSAMTDPRIVEIAAGLSSDDIFDMGYSWGRMLTGQTLEDSRAVGRTLGCDLFKPIEQELSDAEARLGFNPFQDSDKGIVQAKAIIKAALRAHLKGNENGK